MEFLDEATIWVSSGKGGDGCASFRREKFVPRGGPDGGDGGRGGSVIFEATGRRNTLVDYQRQRAHRAEPGKSGQPRQMYGAGGKHCVCHVPIGTMIYARDTGELLADLDEDGARFEIPGGKGGLGNMHFKSSTNRTPREFTPGEEGTELYLQLELKLLGDVGLLGFPNAGKSTFLSRVTAAKPKVASYPFTTLTPNLGVVRVAHEQSFVIADIPGLIEGAADGAGLGHQFLRHVERCACLLHLVSGECWDGDSDPVERYLALRRELADYDAELASRREIIALTKVDLLSDEQRAEWCERLSEAAGGAPVIAISSVSNIGIDTIVHALWHVVQSNDDEDADGPADHAAA